MRSNGVQHAYASDQPPGAEFDLLVIGSGGAGVAAAIQAAEMGARVAIVERGSLGGTCVNVGCIPSKNLLEAATHYHGARMGFPGVAPCTPALDWTAVMAQTSDIVTAIRRSKYADVLASYPEIVLLQGHARLLGDGRVSVGAAVHMAAKIVIATGTSPIRPEIPGLDELDVLDSTTAMELEQLPQSLVVLGGSAVGLELGQMFARFGTTVTILELTSRLLPNEDEAVSDALRVHLAAEGLDIHTNVYTTRVERDGKGVVVHAREGDVDTRFLAEHLLVATGRQPNTRDIGLETVSVATTRGGFIRVDATQRTSSTGIFAAGDVTGEPAYVYVAAAGGRVAAENALSDGQRELDLSAVPNVTFTSPQLASVGLTEARARDAGYSVEVSALPLDHLARARVSHDTRGLVKVVAEEGTGKLLGIHALAPNAGEFIGVGTLAIRLGLSAHDITATLHPYLTWAESVKLAAQGLTTDVTRLSCCS